MSYSIHADLLTEQKKTAYEPSIYLSLLDSGLPHSGLRFTLTGQDNEPTAAVSIPGVAIIRARHNSEAGVQLQRVSDPEIKSQWESWPTTYSGRGYPALFYTGAYVVLVYQNTALGTICWRRSSDAGQSWSNEQTLIGVGFGLAHLQIGVSGGASDSGFFYAWSTYIFFYKYLPASDTWAAVQATNYGKLIIGLGATWAGTANTYRLLLAFQNYTSYANRSLLTVGYTYPSSWTAPRAYVDLHGASGNSYDLRWPSLARLSSGAYWLSFSQASDKLGGGLFNSTQVIAFAEAAAPDYPSGPRWLDVDIPDRLTHLEWSGGVVYSAAFLAVFKSSPVATVTADAGRILNYKWRCGVEGRLTISLDNRDGWLTGLEIGRLGAKLVLERGAIIGSTARRSALEPLWVEGFKWVRDGSQVTLSAVNAPALLGWWQAEVAFIRAGWKLKELLQAIAGLCALGLGDVSNFGSVGEMVLPYFSIQSGQSGRDALSALQAQFGFWYRAAAAGGLEFISPWDRPNVAEFGNGDGQHPTFFVEDERSREIPPYTYVFVVGDGVAGQAQQSNIQAEVGRQLSYFVSRRQISDQGEANLVAGELLTSAGAGVGFEVGCLPVQQLQPLDTAVYGPDDYLVSSIEEFYLTGDSWPWYQRVRLGRVKQAMASLSGLPGTAVHLGGKVYRGEIVAFDAVTWVATVRVEASPAPVAIPCGQWLPAALLTAGAAVAVLLFDESNPNDGLIVGPYGGASPVSDTVYALAGHSHAGGGDNSVRVSKLYESDFGGVALSSDAAGNLSAVGALGMKQLYSHRFISVPINSVVTYGPLPIGNRFMFSLLGNGGQRCFATDTYNGVVIDLNSGHFAVYAGGGTLSGSTGASGKINLQDQSGTLRVENRLIDGMNIAITVFGSD